MEGKGRKAVTESNHILGVLHEVEKKSRTNQCLWYHAAISVPVHHLSCRFWCMLLMSSHDNYEEAMSPEYQIAKLVLKKGCHFGFRMTSKNVKSPGYESKKPLK